MFCRKCGKQLDESFKICPYCGEPVDLKESDELHAARKDPLPVYDPPEPSSVHNAAPKPEPEPIRRQQPDADSAQDENVGGWRCLGFFLGFFAPLLWSLPLVSLVLYIIWKSDRPKMAKAIGQFTLVGLAVGLGLVIIIAVIIGVILAITASMTLFEMLRDFANGTLRSADDLLELLPFIN